MKTATADDLVTVIEPTPLDEYPLAKAYGWKSAQRHTGGMLYLYPPRDRQSQMRDRRINGLHSAELSYAAQKWLNEHFVLEPQDDD